MDTGTSAMHAVHIGCPAAYFDKSNTVIVGLLSHWLEYGVWTQTLLGLCGSKEGGLHVGAHREGW